MRPINVIQSIMPDKEAFASYVNQALDSHVLTNNGPACIALKERLEQFLGLKDIALCANGTLGLEISLHAADCAGKKIITTPFTYVATASAALWVGCEVVFADIDPETLAISPDKIARHMSADIAGILPVNIYGHPCDYEGIEKAANGLPVIYDAAQAFGATLNGRQLLDFGNLAVCSLHATKVFHSAEGGFVVAHTQKQLRRLNLLRAFGHNNDDHYCLGINAKMSELHAIMGLTVLEKFNEQRELRKRISQYYHNALKGRFRYPQVPDGFESNYGYFPLIFDKEEIMERVTGAMTQENIRPRRYFYPALTTLPYIHEQKCPIAEDISRRVLCLPIYGDLPLEKAEMIASIVNRNAR